MRLVVSGSSHVVILSCKEEILQFISFHVEMSRRKSNQLPNNLPQLQNVIKRDPLSYKDEVDKISSTFSTCLIR